VVQPGKHDIAPPVLLMHRFWTPAVLEPHAVSLVHDSLHQAPLQVAELGHWVVPHGEFEAFEQGSPMSGTVPAQMNVVDPVVSGWHVVPENAVQSRFVEHPGKQTQGFPDAPLCKQTLVTPTLLAPQLVSVADVQLVMHQPVCPPV
jgi:hypothetical protein